MVEDVVLEMDAVELLTRPGLQEEGTRYCAQGATVRAVLKQQLCLDNFQVLRPAGQLEQMW